MKRAVVGMISSYSGLTYSDWLWHQTPQAFGVWDQMQLLSQEPNPDFLLLYQFDFPRFQPQQQSWRDYFRKKPSWRDYLRRQSAKPAPELPARLKQVPKERCLYLLREPPLEEVVPTNQHNYAAAQQYCQYVSGPDYDAPVPGYMPAIWYLNNSFQELNEGPVPDKEKPCSWITSGIDRTANHQRRLQFLQLLRDRQVAFDLFGRNLPGWSNPIGPLTKKWHGLAPYYYNLSIENYAENDLYVSEKLWDALLSWCLPIYYGGPAADKLLPPGSFLRLPSLDEQGIAYIRDVTATPDAWYAAKEAIAEARQIILHKLNLMNWLSEYTQQLT